MARTRSARTRAIAPPGLRAAGVDDAATRVPALEAEAVVELDAEVDEIGDPGRRLVRETRDCARPAEPAARCERVLSVQGRVVVLAQRGSDAALREIAGRRAQRPLREQEDVCLARRRTAPRTDRRRLRRR